MINELFDVIRHAGEMIVNARQFDVEIKEGHANFVTTVDAAVEEYLKGELARLCPDASFIGEEQENAPLGDEPTWIIDPIDGTTNFIHDFRFSSISVALVEQGKPVLGAVYQPYTQEMFHAVRGEGAYLNGQRIHVKNMSFEQALVGFGTSPYNPELAEKSLQAALQFLLQSSDIRRGGSAALDLAYVAAGRQDIYFELLLKPWDYAAGALLVEEAGGVFVMPRLAEPDYGRIEAVLAAAPSCYEDACRVLKPYW
ncbi:MAG: inositol monophosphatase family protein [bacterium]|nr:inositol monophosphatase family protein [bacterium]